MITLGSYQAMGNLMRVYKSQAADIPAQVSDLQQVSGGQVQAAAE